MNVLIITDYFEVGGNTTYIANVRKTLESLGYSVKLITYRSSQAPTGHQYTGINHYDLYIKDFQLRFFPSRVLVLYQFLIQLLPTWKPDIILSDLCQAAGALIICKLFFHSLASAPFLYQFHGSNAREKQSGIEYFDQNHHPLHIMKNKFHFFILYTFEKIVLDRVNFIIIFSEYSRLLLKQLRVRNKVYKIFPGSEDIYKETYHSYTKKEAKKLCGLTDKDKIVFILARLEPRKGVPHILRMLHSHPSFFMHAKVVLCSQFDGYFGSDIIKMHSEYSFGINIILFNNPTKNDRALLYRASDVTLIPSLDLETFGFVALESYATGTPVVAYNVGAFKELIDYRFLVTPIGDGTRLLRKTEQLLSTPKIKLIAMSKSVMSLCERFSWESYVHDCIRLAISARSTL